MNYTYDHIHLTTQSVDEWVQWYVTSMRAQVLSRSGSSDSKTVNLDVGGASVRLSNATGVEKYIWDRTGQRVLPPEGYHHFGFIVDDLDACIADLVARGAKLEGGVRQASPGVRSGFMLLPGGVRVELCEKRE